MTQLGRLVGRLRQVVGTLRKAIVANCNEDGTCGNALQYDNLEEATQICVQAESENGFLSVGTVAEKVEVGRATWKGDAVCEDCFEVGPCYTWDSADAVFQDYFCLDHKACKARSGNDW